MNNSERTEFLLRRQKEKEKILLQKNNKKEKKILQAINTLADMSFSELVNSGVGQNEYEEAIAQQGLRQNRGESNRQLQRRAAGICIQAGLSADQIAKRIISSDQRIQTAKVLGNISSDQKEHLIKKLENEISSLMAPRQRIKKN